MAVILSLSTNQPQRMTTAGDRNHSCHQGHVLNHHPDSVAARRQADVPPSAIRSISLADSFDYSAIHSSQIE